MKTTTQHDVSGDTVDSGRMPQTRMLALGSSALTEGFALIGFETVQDATAEDLEEVLGELVRGNQRAMVIVERTLARGTGRWLNQVRNEGGRIVLAEVPELSAPSNYHPLVEDLVESILGPQALEERT